MKKVLIAIADVLKLNKRSNDIVMRLGGDEFAGVLPGYNINIIDKTWEKIKNTCIEISKEEDLPITLQVSFAVVEFNQNSKDLSILLKQADTKQYQVKKEHHNAR